MRLAIDATPILADGKGLALFLEAVLDALVHTGAVTPAAIYVDDSFFADATSRWPGLPVKSVRSRPALLWERIFLPRQVAKDGIELLFTGRDRTVCEPRCKTVVYLFEVPDYRNTMVLTRSNGWYPKATALLTRFIFNSVTRDVTYFIASSESTKRDLVTRYRVSPDIITVVYPGLRTLFCYRGDSTFRVKARRRFTGGYPYVLHFATDDPRDNTPTALAAFSQALPYLDGKLVLLLAGTRTNSTLKRDVARYGLSNRICYAGFLRDFDLVLSFAGAEAYLDPTLYEGFGFQLLEAMACGVPVLSSRVTSVPEVVGNAAMLFDPYDVDGFASGLAQIMNETDLRNFMVARGLERASQFTWESTIRQLATTFENVGRRNGTYG